MAQSLAKAALENRLGTYAGTVNETFTNSLSFMSQPSAQQDDDKVPIFHTDDIECGAEAVQEPLTHGCLCCVRQSLDIPSSSENHKGSSSTLSSQHSNSSSMTIRTKAAKYGYKLGCVFAVVLAFGLTIVITAIVVNSFWDHLRIEVGELRRQNECLRNSVGGVQKCTGQWSPPPTCTLQYVC